MKKRILSFILAVCMILPLIPLLPLTAVATENITVYRNPVDDPAVSGSNAAALAGSYLSGKIKVREEVLEAWCEQIISATGVSGGDDVVFYVDTFDVDASLTGRTTVSYSIFSIPIYAGYFFGQYAVRDGVVKSANETKVNVVDADGNKLLSSDITVNIKGYVDINYDINGNTNKIQVPLDGTLAASAPTASAEEWAATNSANGTKYVFAGWDTDGDGDYDDADAAYLAKVIDVIADESSIAADTVDGITLSAVYDEYYTITWENYDGFVLSTSEVKKGETPVYNGAGEPTRSGDDKYSYYTFTGFGEIVPATAPATYTAQYAGEGIKSYKVSFVDEYGVLLKEKYYEYGTFPAAPSTDKEATAQFTYTFKGWDKKIEVVTGEATYTALYDETLNSYTITWEVGEGTWADGTTAPKTTTVNYGELPEAPETPVKAETDQYSYAFGGWNNIVTVVSDATYTANFIPTEKDKVTVSYVVDGTAVSSETFYTGLTATKPTTNPTKLHYTFDAWCTDEACTTEFDFSSEVNESIVLYARFTENEKITIIYKDGNTTVGSQTFYADCDCEACEIAEAGILFKDGYRFDGWFTEDGAEFDYIVSEDTTVYAKWTQLFVVDFVGPEAIDQTVADGECATEPEEPVIGDIYVGHKFMGWFADEDCTIPYDFSTPITAPTTIYSKWIERFTVSYDTLGGSEIESEKVWDGDSATRPADPTLSGYNFMGWTLDGAEYDFSAPVTSDITLVAVWEKKAIIVTPTTITLSADTATATFGKVDAASVLAQLGASVIADGAAIADAVVTLETNVALLGAGEHKITLSYRGTEPENPDDTSVYGASTVTATLVIEKAAANISVISQTLKYGSEVIYPFAANCTTIDILAGVDVHDETYLKAIAQVKIPAGLYSALSIAAKILGMDLNDLSIEDVKTLLGYAKMAEGLGNESISAVIAVIKKYEPTLDKLIETLKKIQAELPMDSELHTSVVSEITLPENMGLYVVATLSADNNYTTEVDAGYLVITPNGIKASLAWNETDSNYVITLDKMASFDLGATATVIESTLDGVELDSLDAIENHVDNLFIGVNANGDVVIDRVRANSGEDMNAILSGVGAYAQVAYVSNWDNVMYYAEPIVRPIIVSPSIADVAILDVNGNENIAQVFTYDGKPHGVSVTVDGKANVSGLTVKYIGSDTTVDGWYRSEAPTDAGVYTVVAVYTEKDAEGNVIKAGSAVGVIVINPADNDFALTDRTQKYTGGEWFADLSRPEYDYITVAIDRTNNIAYINLPDDTADHINRIITMLPATLEEKLNSFLSKYSDFDGDVYTSTLKAELNDIINTLVEYDLTSAAEAKAGALVDELIAELKANEDVEAAVAKLKAELDSLKNKVSSKIPDEIEDMLVSYIKDIVTVTDDSIEIDVDKVKADLKAKIAELETELPATAVEELYEMVDEVVAAVENHVDLDAIEGKVRKLISVIETIDSEDAEALIKYVVGAAYGFISAADFSEAKDVVSAVYAKIEAQGYIDYAKNMLSSISSVYGKDIDLSEVKASVDALVSKVEQKLTSGNFDRDDLAAVEGYIDDILTSLISVVDQIPDGQLVFGKNPTEIGTYDCYAINISANYKAEFLSATLVIEPAECTHQTTTTTTTTTPASCTEPGVIITTKTCDECGEILSETKESIPATGHTEETVKGYPASCTETGLTDGIKCSVCGEIIKAQEVIPATGHTEETVKGYPASCTETGLTDGIKCSVCGEIIKAQEVIPVTNHTPTEAFKENIVEPTETTDGSYDLVIYCTVCRKEISRETIIVPACPDTGDDSVYYLATILALATVSVAALSFKKRRREED